jgi:hypothetical protein
MDACSEARATLFWSNSVGSFDPQPGLPQGSSITTPVSHFSAGFVGTMDEETPGLCLELPATITVAGDAGQNVSPFIPPDADCTGPFPSAPYKGCFGVDVTWVPPGGGGLNFAFLAETEFTQICAGCAVVLRFGFDVTSMGDPVHQIGDIQEDMIPWVVSADGHKFWPEGDYSLSVFSYGGSDCGHEGYYPEFDGILPEVGSPLCGPTHHTSGPGSLVAAGPILLPAPSRWSYSDGDFEYCPPTP